MNQNTMKTVLGASAALLIATGCSTTVVRENIISTVNTGIGVQIAQNAKTQLYELKLGYMRNQFYSIPTSKRVGGSNDVTSVTNHIGTPQLVSGIGGSADIKGTSFGGGVAENFAVGETAVASPAAVMMYMATARTPEAAKAMAEAMKAMKLQSEQTIITYQTTNTNIAVTPVQSTTTNIDAKYINH
jgi:hypothetical protein